MANGNGNNKLLYWLLGILAAAVMSLAGSWGLSVNSKLDAIMSTHSELRSQAAVQDTRIRSIEDRVNGQLNTIDAKLNLLLRQQGSN